jgi:acyl-CoA thioesterase I
MDKHHSKIGSQCFRSAMQVVCQMAILVLAATSLPAQEKPTGIPTENNDKSNRADALIGELQKKWPKNRTVRLVFHGHSVPAGYFVTPIVKRWDSYPALAHQRLCDLFPTAVIDVCVTAIGGENSQQGAARFEADVLTLKPDMVFIDYGLNDRRLSSDESRRSLQSMVEACQQRGVLVVLLTPTPDSQEKLLDDEAPLSSMSQQIRLLGDQFGIEVVDSYRAFQTKVRAGQSVETFLSQSNHPNRAGHEVVSELIGELFESMKRRFETRN